MTKVLAPTGALEEGILSVRPCVCSCVILFKITVKMSSSSILKSPGPVKKELKRELKRKLKRKLRRELKRQLKRELKRH